MAKFGTDGIRGIYGQDITHELAFKIGLALATIKSNAQIVVGRDNRPGGKELLAAFCSGVMLGGGNVFNAGICTTPCISYLSSTGFDFGVVITASHNPPEYNGIKIFGKNGIKTEYNTEVEIQKLINSSQPINNNCLGTIKKAYSLKNKYINFLKLLLPKTTHKVVVDCSNGASKTIAKKVLGKSAIFVGQGTGKRINQNCGALHPKNVQNAVIKNNADIGFAFDGDADRIIVATKTQIYDGDNILFALSKYFLATRKNFGQISATIMSNMGLENALKKHGVEVCYTDVGDKYVIRQMQQEGLILGGEQSGHIIASEFLPTGDGLLAALLLLHAQKFLKVDFDTLLYFTKFAQHEVSYKTNLKAELIDDEELKEYIEFVKQKLGSRGRVIVRASGTEPKLRIMAETQEQEHSKQVAGEILKQIKRAEERLCVE